MKARDKVRFYVSVYTMIEDKDYVAVEDVAKLITQFQEQLQELRDQIKPTITDYSNIDSLYIISDK